ncbi:MAG: hypothetical protein V4709_11730 [Pseudomonadota bacterium]|jgi:hypothetical protein
MNKVLVGSMLAIALAASAGCANRGRAAIAQVAPFDRILLLHQQTLSDEQLIAQIEEQRLGGLVTPADLDALRKAQVSDGVVRYLQGRAVAQQQLNATAYLYQPRYSYYSPLYLRDGHHFGGHHHRRHH